MALPVVGSLFYGGRINGRGPVVFTQPNGIGTAVSPPAPSIYPAVFQGYPQSVFAYQGLYSLGCAHWVNEVEVITEFDPETDEQAAILVCPVCGYVQQIVEPAVDWWETFYGLYNTGLEIATLPVRNE